MSEIADKWGGLVAARGFAQVPNYLMLINQFLSEERRLSALELLLVLQLVGTWWRKGDKPFPSMGTLAARCNVSVRQIQRSITRLESIGLLTRVSRRRKGMVASNAYDLEPLVALLDDVAKAFPNEFPRNIRKTRPASDSDSPSADFQIIRLDNGAIAMSALTERGRQVSQIAPGSAVTFTEVDAARLYVRAGEVDGFRFVGKELLETLFVDESPF